MTKVIYPVIGRQTSLPFYLTGIGISDPEYHVTRDKGLVSHQLLFTSGGEGRLIVGGEEFVQTKGSAFYLPPSVPHEYYPANGNWITNWIVFRGEFAGQMLANLGFDSFRFSPEINTQKPAQLFERILVAAADPVNCGEKTSALVYEYILAMRTAMLFPDSRNNVGSITRQALLYIDSPPADTWRISPQKHLQDFRECQYNISAVFLKQKLQCVPLNILQNDVSLRQNLCFLTPTLT